MLFRYALISFRRYKMQNILTVLQLAAALTMTAFMISAVSLRLSRYTPFREEFTSNGRLVVCSSFAYNGDLSGEYTMINSSEDMSRALGADVKVLGIHLNSAYIPGRENDFAVRSADDRIIDCYTPMLSAGEWFSGEGICAAVSENSGCKVGDRFVLHYFSADGNEKEFEVTVTSLVKKDGRLAGLAGENDGSQKDTFEIFYGGIDSNNKNTLLLRESDMPEDMPRGFTGTMLLNYSDTADEAALTERLTACGCIYSLPMSELEKASKNYLSQQIYELLPLIAILLIMALIGSISTSALSTREQLRDYAVFSLCGLKKNSCILIGLMQSFICSVLAGIVSAAAMLILGAAAPERFYLSPGLMMFSGVGTIALLFVIVSLTVPALMIGKYSVKDQLNSN